MNYLAVFYPVQEEAERKVVIISTPLDASQDTIKTNKAGHQLTQEDMAIQTVNYKRGKKVDILRIPPNITTDDETCISTPIDVHKSFSFSQYVPTVVQQHARPS